MPRSKWFCKTLINENAIYFNLLKTHDGPQQVLHEVILAQNINLDYLVIIQIYNCELKCVEFFSLFQIALMFKTRKESNLCLLFFLFAFTIKAEITSAGVIMIVNTNPNALMCCKPF